MPIKQSPNLTDADFVSILNEQLGSTNWQGSETDIPDGSITHAKLAADAVESDNIKDGAVGTDQVANSAITAAKIADGVIPAEDVPPDDVTLETSGGKLQVKDGGINHAKLGADAVETDNIKAKNVTAAELDDNIIAGIPYVKSNSAITLGAQGNVFGLYWGSSGNDVTETTVPAQGYFFGDSDNHPFAAQTALTEAGTKFLTLNHTAWREIAGANTVDFTQNLALAQIGGSVRAEVISSGDVIGWGDFEISGNVVARGTGANLAYRIPITLYDQGQAESGGSPVGNGYDVRITINPNREQLLAKHVRGLIKDILARNVADLQGDLPIARTSGNLPSARLDASAAVQASDPLADTALMALIVNGILHSASIAHIRKHILPGVNEFASYALGGGASVGQATLTGSGNQLTLTPNSADETDLQIDIKPNVLIALVRVSNPAEFHLGLVSSTVYQGNLNPKTYTINFVAGEFQTVGSYDFSAGGNAGEAVKVVSYGDRLRQADLVQTVRALAQASHIKIPSEHATRSAIDAGDDLAHEHIELLAELLDTFYAGWTSVSGSEARYTDSQLDLIRTNLPVDLTTNTAATVPTVANPVILRSNATWGGPPGMVWAFDFLSGGERYVLGITTGGNSEEVWKRVGGNWVELWDDGEYQGSYASDPVFMQHWADAADGDIKLADAYETYRHNWSIDGISSNFMMLYRRGQGTGEQRDIAAMGPNYGGGNILNFSWNRFNLKPADDSLTTAMLQDDAVTQAKIADDAVGNDQLADNAVGTAQVANDAITTDKIADSTITADKMATGVIPPATPTWSRIGHNTDVDETYRDIVTGATANMVLTFITECYYSNENDNLEFNNATIRFGNLSTSDRWIPIRAASGGARFMIKRIDTGGKVQIRRAGAVSSTNQVWVYHVANATE